MTSQLKSSLIPKKVTMAMTKGRPGSLSSPSFSFRFKNAEDETLEELIEINENNESPETSHEKSTSQTLDPPNLESITPPASPVKATSKLPIPKLYGKRTQSLDEGSPELSSSTDTWALLSEIKGKIARTVEEKLHSSGIYKKDTKDGTKPPTKPLSPVEAEEVTEDLDLNESAKVESTPFSAVRRMWSGSESPQLRLRKKEFHSSQPNVDEIVSFSDLLLESSKSIPERESPSPEKSSLPNISEPEKLVDGDNTIEENLHDEVVEELETLSESIELFKEIETQNKWQKYKYRVYFIILALILWHILPSFLNGLILGVALTIYAINFWQQINKPVKYHSEIDKPSATNLVIPLPSSTEVHPTVIRKAWMNELLCEYSPENYHLSMTESVLVRLDGCALRLSYPKSKIHKRAMWNESIHESSFIYQRYYDLKGAKVELLPEGLARKRRWSRRYPICIQFPEAPKARDSASSHPHLIKNNEKVLMLFARSGRDKEEWFWRLREALLSSSDKSNANLAAEYKQLQQKLFKYHVYMSRLIQSPASSAMISSSEINKQLSHDSDSNSSSPVPSLTDNVDWLNVLLGRCCADVLLCSEDNEWIERISERIQRKLSLIKVPYFMEELRLSDLEIGSQLPQISNVSSPYQNERGLWFHVNVSYFGSFRMTLETKLNLLRLKKESTCDGVENFKDSGSCDGNGGSSSSGSLPRLSAIYDSEAEESVESSSDEEPFPDTREGDTGDETVARSTTGNKILRLVDSIAQSRYFQHATEYKYVKKAMVGVSNTPLILTVELLSLSGTLAINIPPPPTDRLWYGFRNNPDLVLVAKPKVGERQVQIAQITDWIEKKLIVEFQRILVLPNMEDLVIPILNSSFSQKEPTTIIPATSSEVETAKLSAPFD